MGENETKVNFAEIANSAKNLAKQYRSVLTIVDAMEKIGGLEAYCADTQKRVAELQQQSGEVAAKLIEVRNDLSTAESALASTKNEAAEIKANAVERAEADAGQIKKSAEASIAADKKAADRILADVNAKIKSANSELVDVQGKISAANNELSRVNKLIAEVKAKF